MNREADEKRLAEQVLSENETKALEMVKKSGALKLIK